MGLDGRDEAGLAALATTVAETETSPSWRDLLIQHAVTTYHHAAKGGQIAEGVTETPLFAAVEAAVGAIATDLVRSVETYAVGAAVLNASAEGSTGDPPPEMIRRLGAVLGAVASGEGGPLAARKQPPSVIQSELWQLLYKVRESAELAYARELDLVELDRRILFLLHNIGPLVPAEISAAVGVDKAQVSRSVKRLLDIRMVERDQLRAPLRLTRKGREHSERLLRLAELRNRELTFDIGDAELEAFFAGIEKLLDQAVVLYEQERKLGQAGSGAAETPQFPRPGAAVESESRSGERIVLDRSRIISPLMTLSSYFSRSGSLAFKRLTGLSNFEAWVLNEIGRDSPIEWNDLVERLDRDHSQAGRTVNALVERGIIERHGGPGRRHGSFAPTAEGQRLFDIIQDASRQRSAYLMSPLSPEERDAFLGTFDKIRRNAIVQLERERAFEQLGQP